MGVARLRQQSAAQQQRPARERRALEKADEGHGSDVLPAAAEGLDAEILRLLVPATLAVFLDPAMALIDTGALQALSGRCSGCRRNFADVASAG